MIAENLSPQQTKAERWIVWVYAGPLISALMIVPVMVAISVIMPNAQTSWFSVLLVLAACLIAAILAPKLFSPYVFVRRHTQQAFVLVGLLILSGLILYNPWWSAMLGEEVTPACCTAFPFGLFLLLGGSIAGIRQVRRGDCLLMELAGEGKELPRPWAKSESVASTSVPAALSAVDENVSGQRATVGCKFYGWWVLANMLGWAATWGTGVLAGLPAFLGALLLRKGQASVLREKLGKDAAQDFAKTSWLGASFTTVGVAATLFLLALSEIGFVVDRLPQPNEEKLAMYDTIIALILASVIGILGGFFTSVAQWRSVLRERFSHLRLWIAANSLGWGLGWLGGALVILMVSSTQGSAWSAAVRKAIEFVVPAGLLVGAVIGAITGLALIRVFKHPLPPASSDQATPSQASLTP
jgi:hypothetical protein